MSGPTFRQGGPSVKTAAPRTREVMEDGIVGAAKPKETLKAHLADMDAIIEFGRAIEDVMWRGDYEETRRRAFDVLSKTEILAAVRGADPADNETRALLQQVSGRSEHKEVRAAALEALTKS